MEQWDIYDINKQKTGRLMNRNDWHMKPGDYHLTVLGLVERSDGRYLITKRRLDKEWAPGWWEVPGGGVHAGESSREAVNREVREETGLDVSEAELYKTFTYRRESPEEQNNYFVDVYRFRMDFTEADVKVQPEEVSGYEIASLAEIRACAEKGEFLHFSSIEEIFRD